MSQNAKKIPRTTVAGVSLPRILIGTNWLLGWSHTGHAADNMIKRRHNTRESLEEMINTYMDYGVNAIMGPIKPSHSGPLFLEAIKSVEQKRGEEIIVIDTPVINVDDNAAARAEALETIKFGADNGAKFCLLHHSSVEQLVNKNLEQIPRLTDYLKMIRDCGMLPGLSAHMPELILYSDAQGYDVETYIQIFNCLGFMMQIEIETVSRIIHNAKKPVMTIKPMAAGRCTPYVGLTFNIAALRDIDMITLGAHTPDEVHEDMEIVFAALEHRYPDLEGRSSPAADQSVLAK